MKDNILVLEAKQSNYEELREIFFTVRQNAFHWIEPEILKLSDFDESTKDELILVASIGDKIVGFVSIWVPDKFIHNLFILQDFQGKGIGTALVNEAIKRVGLPLTLKCVKSNTKALNYYKSHNWKIEKEEMSNEVLYYLMKYSNQS
ncbi:GNAT family N-acetyltransferase [Tissierella sp. MB52-C2]|uniref:GNAT family N-acetyltransferase n=1 Tax=Tissierella sp. MB52-C2 TaxID=3070999 RepID=UPI00280B99DD|nr:GNAT family N-acetyltransferase [Tissierella sp. MB52-C2]WMM26338.1 GNAT family N-acetyltransferase [Tissierella sp. MB52-C2]